MYFGCHGNICEYQSNSSSREASKLVLQPQTLRVPCEYINRLVLSSFMKLPTRNNVLSTRYDYDNKHVLIGDIIIESGGANAIYI